MSRNDKQRRFDLRAAACFVLAYAALFTSAGAAVDLTRAHRAESRLEAAASATAARLTRASASSPLRTLQIAAEGMLAPELSAFADPEAMVNVTVIGRNVRISASARMPTIFMSMFQFESLPIDVTTTVAPSHSPNLIG